MATVSTPLIREYGPEWNGIVMPRRKLDRAQFVERWLYELVPRVLAVTSFWLTASPRRSPSRIDAS